MIDLNTLFGEFLTKAIAAAVEEKVSHFKEEHEQLIKRVVDLESQLSDLADKVDESDVERAVERHIESINFNEVIDTDSLFEEMITNRSFDEAVRESFINSLTRISY